MRTISSSATLLRSLVNNVLDLARIEAGKVTLVAHEFRLRELIDSIVDVLGPQAQANGLYLKVDELPAGIDTLVGDRDHVAQVLINLVANAVKFTAQGGVTLRISKDGESADRVAVTWHIVDTGVGMTAEAAARIFESFAQADEETRRRYGGTGLGTAIAKELVEKMGGKIGVESAPGRGSRFWFSLEFGRGVPICSTSRLAHEVVSPAPAPTQAVTAFSNTAASAHRVGGRILVVEDNPANRKVAAKILELGGHDVHVADSGPSALLKAACERYDLLLLDMELPGCSGLEVLHRLRACFGDEVQAVILTANATEEARVQCLAAGVAGFLTKPISAQTFLSTIDAALAAQGPTTPSARDCRLVSISRLEEQLALGKDLDFVLELVDLWREDADKTVTALELAIRRRDPVQARRHLHLLEGGASELGARALLESCQQLRTLVRGAAAGEWHEAMARVRRAYHGTCEVLDGLASVATIRCSSITV